MILLLKVNYTFEYARAVFEKYQEILSKLQVPDFMKQKGPYWYSGSGDDGGAFLFYEFDRANFSEAYDYLIKIQRMYHGVPSFKREIIIGYDAEDMQRTTPPN